METTTNNPIFSTAYFPPIAYVAEAMAEEDGEAPKEEPSDPE